jgi:hypothetical protein
VEGPYAGGHPSVLPEALQLAGGRRAWIWTQYPLSGEAVTSLRSRRFRIPYEWIVEHADATELMTPLWERPKWLQRFTRTPLASPL